MNKLDKIYDDMKTIGIDGMENFMKNYNDNDKQITIQMLLFVAYDIYKYDLMTKITEERIKRQFQDKFKNQVIKKYGYCVISNDDVDICEACHIIPFCESDYTNMYNINNGLLLSSGLHKLFDQYSMSIDNDGIVVLSEKILSKSSFKNYHKYHNMKLNLDTKTMINISTHHKKFIELNDKK